MYIRTYVLPTLLPSLQWSFAITSVEVFSLAELPYPSVKNKNILAHVLLGNRPIRPNNCPHEM